MSSTMQNYSMAVLALRSPSRAMPATSAGSVCRPFLPPSSRTSLPLRLSRCAPLLPLLYVAGIVVFSWQNQIRGGIMKETKLLPALVAAARAAMVATQIEMSGTWPIWARSSS